MPLDHTLTELARRLNVGVEISSATPVDAEPFRQFMNRHFRRQKPQGYCEWQFWKTPQPAELFLAWDDDKLVGCFGVQMRTLSTDWPCAFTVDLLIDEAYRNRGLSLLMEEQVHGFAVSHHAVAITTLPNHDGMRMYTGIPSWRCIGEIHTLEAVLPLKPAEALQPPPTSELVSFMKDDRFREWRFRHKAL